MGRRRAGIRLAALVITSAFVAGACQYLLGYDPSDPTLDPFASPKPIATYASGRATIDIAGQAPLVLDRLTGPASLFAEYGADAVFTGSGWYVRVFAASPSGFGGLGSGFVQLDRIVDGEHWTSADPSRCVVTMELIDPTGLKGRATCKGVRWADALGSGLMAIQPAYIKGQDPFDAEITFQAEPAPARS